MQEAPGHRSDVVEELEGGVGSVSVDRSGRGEESEMAIDLFG